MIENKNKVFLINYIIFTFILLSFFFGFYIKENSGGGEIDEIHILNNFNLIQNSNIFVIDWSKYESTSLPLYYFLYSIIFNDLTLEKIRFINFSISLFTFYLFYMTLKKKYEYIRNDQICLLSSLILLSPYFRTSAFNALEENLAILFVVFSFFILNYLKRNNYTIFIVLISSSLAFYSRSNYLIFYLIMFIDFFNFKKIFDNKNLQLSIISLVLISPSIYFLLTWGGIVPPSPGSQVRIQTINLTNIPLILNIILIYLVPFAIFKFKLEKINFNFRNCVIFILILAFFIFLYSQLKINYYAGGALNKLLFILFPQNLVEFFTILISFLTFILFIKIFKKNWKILLFVILNMIIFLKLNFIFQEYFDPIFLILALMFSDKYFLKINNLSQFIYFLLIYFSLFLVAGIIYQYLIY